MGSHINGRFGATSKNNKFDFVFSTHPLILWPADWWPLSHTELFRLTINFRVRGKYVTLGVNMYDLSRLYTVPQPSTHRLGWNFETETRHPKIAKLFYFCEKNAINTPALRRSSRIFWHLFVLYRLQKIRQTVNSLNYRYRKFFRNIFGTRKRKYWIAL